MGVGGGIRNSSFGLSLAFFQGVLQGFWGFGVLGLSGLWFGEGVGIEGVLGVQGLRRWRASGFPGVCRAYRAE